MSKNYNEFPEEEMTVDIQIDDNTTIECAVVTVLEVDGQDYIVLEPIVDEDDDLYGQIWFYGLNENPDDPNEEPELIVIDDDEVYEAVADAFDEYLDTQEFDEIIEE
ncbi:MAG: DUF1292 domain-containing protein [Lachnospiraceae bacterium]|nr:DUF1292 domain-containing protein [Lachnospiraceae bacterium]